jgi:hypothetical protein
VEYTAGSERDSDAEEFAPFAAACAAGERDISSEEETECGGGDAGDAGEDGVDCDEERLPRRLTFIKFVFFFNMARAE